MWLYLRRFLIGLRLIRRRECELVLENLVLRQQLLVWERTGRRARLTADDRRFWSTVARGWPGWRAYVQLVEPATVVCWHRTAWRRYWTWRSRKRGGRPRIDAETQALIRRMARDNPTWGAVRIVRELRALGTTVSATTVRRYRSDLQRKPLSPGWQTFLRMHAPEIWAEDPFTVQTLTFRTLFVFFVISHDPSRILHWKVTAHPTDPWIWRQILEATPWNRRPRFLIRDRDACYGVTSSPRPPPSASAQS